MLEDCRHMNCLGDRRNAERSNVKYCSIGLKESHIYMKWLWWIKMDIPWKSQANNIIWGPQSVGKIDCKANSVWIEGIAVCSLDKRGVILSALLKPHDPVDGGGCKYELAELNHALCQSCSESQQRHHNLSSLFDNAPGHWLRASYNWFCLIVGSRLLM